MEVVIVENIVICDMCYFESYACNYEAYYYKLSDAEQPFYLEMFLNKLPYTFQKELKEEWEKAKANGSSTNTLGGLIRPNFQRNFLS